MFSREKTTEISNAKVLIHLIWYRRFIYFWYTVLYRALTGDDKARSFLN